MTQKNITIVVVLIFMLIVGLFSCLGLLGYQKYLQQEETRFIQMKTDIVLENSKLDQYFQALQGLTGFFLGSLADSKNIFQLSDATVSNEMLLNVLKDAQNTKNDPKNTEYLGLSTLIPLKIEILEEDLDKKTSPINIEVLLNACVDRIYNLQSTIQRLENHIEDVQSKIKLQETTKETVVNSQKVRLDSLKDETNKLIQQYQAQLENIQRQKIATEDERDKDVENKATLEDAVRKQKGDFEGIIAQKKNEIRRIQAEKYGRTVYSDVTKQKVFKPEEEKEDGRVIFADPLSKSVYIDLGKDSQIKRGLKFDVYRNADRGSKKFVGRLEVQRIQDKISMATIIEIVDPLDPIVDGDILINPIYRADKQIFITIAGSFKEVDLDTITKFIEAVGGQIEKRVTAKTNYVVVGQRGDEHSNYRDAVKFGIPLMTEDVLLKYIGY
ncbi:MAG: hypothetical protein KBC30_10420 [Planctomycetes bacterium]|jgi:RNase H-fold protein (predicted Holliday junction resolvase)|nr:hypothetical protein [Planctomycetota bacterium]HNZ66145.1 hypothetical protein [Planctomycetota bacterium]HPY76001.1 hypothetical protein [Planctomycetota bacterium]HQB01545.1 hypothetical protein [Planctomycetota bacterium]HRU52222.1 hypothetical protein [Planctomycetota bacterium]